MASCSNNESFIIAKKPSASIRPRSNIPAPGSLKFGVKKEEKPSSTEQSHLPSASGGQLSSTVVDDRDLKRQSSVATVVGYATQPTSRSSLISDDIHSPDPAADSLNQTFTHPKLLYKLIEAEFSQSIGKRVCLGGEKQGTLRYFGPLHVAEGLFCGIELEEELGQHDGFIDGRRYFKALPRHGIFAPVEKVKIVDSLQPTSKVDIAVVAPHVANMNVESGLNSVNRFDQTFDVGDAFLPSICDNLMDNADAELLDDIEPHLMSYSMLDDDNVAETAGQSNPLLNQSFELSDSLMFLKQPVFPGFDGSMSASQLSTMVLSNDESNQKPIDNDELANEKLVYDEENDLENMYFEEQTTPVCCDVNFLKDIENSFAKTGIFSSSTPCNSSTHPNDVDADGKRQEKVENCGQDLYMRERNEQKLRSSDDHANLDDTFAVDDEKTMTRVKLRQLTVSSTKNNAERPISTISADTGYQGDTEYDTQSGRSVSPPEPEDLDAPFEKPGDRTIILQKISDPVKKDKILSDTHMNGVTDRRPSNDDDHAMSSSSESLICETVFRDKKGNVVKVVRGEPSASSSSTKSRMKTSVTIENIKDMVNENKPPPPPTAQSEKPSSKRESTKKPTSTSPEMSPMKTKRLKPDLVNGLDSSRKVQPTPKKEAEKSENVLPRSRPVKEIEPPPKKVPRPPPKPSKHAEIMAKLQQSMAQDKEKPKKEAKSRVFTPSDGAKVDDSSLFVPSRSQSRASSILTSAQISPNEPVTCVAVGGTAAETKTSAVDQVVMNGDSLKGHSLQKKTVAKTSEPPKNVAKAPLKRDNSHDSSRNGLPPTGQTGGKRLPVTKAATLSSSVRLNKVNVNQSTSSGANQTFTKSVAEPPKESDHLLEKKDEQLKLAKERLIHGAKGFEAMCITIKHYDEQVIPALYHQLSEIKKELADAKENSDGLLQQKIEVNTEKEILLSSIENLKKENEETLKKAENHLRAEMEKKIFALTNEHDSEIKKVMDDFRSKEKRLTKGYEKRQNDDALQFQHKITQLKEQNVKDLSELKCAHTKEIEDLKCEFENLKSILQAKLAESQELCERYKKEARGLEATLMKDTEKKIHHVNERLSVYQQEIDSLRVVVEMKNGEVHELRSKCQTLEKDLETLPQAKTKIIVLEQKNAELKEALELRKQSEKRLSQKHLQLQQTCEREKERSVRLSMTNEQLQYRLQHLMMSQSAYETPMSRFPSDDSDADSIIRDKPMSQSLIQIYAGSSPRVSKHVPVTVYTTEGISRALLFDQSDSESTSNQRKRASSERKASLSDDSSASPSPVTTNRAKSAEKSSSPVSSSSISPNQRRISPLRRRNISGTSLVGAPGVETVTEVSELRDCCDGQNECSNTKLETDGAGDCGDALQVRKISKSSSQGQGCWTDSGIFTSSFHSETAVDHPLHGSGTAGDHNVCSLVAADMTVDESKPKEDDESTPKRN